MLLLQGTRDKLANTDLITAIAKDLGDKAKLCIIEAADHAFKVPKKVGKSHEQVNRL